MDEREELLRENLGEGPNAPEVEGEDPKRPINTTPLFPLRTIWPDVLDYLQMLLIQAGEHQLAATVDTLQVYDRCRCGADLHVQPRPTKGNGYGPRHRNIVLYPPGCTNLDTGLTIEQEVPRCVTAQYMTILDVVADERGGEKIACRRMCCTGCCLSQATRGSSSRSRQFSIRSSRYRSSWR